MTMPFKEGFRVLSPYGRRTDPITGEPNCWHGGVDLAGSSLSVCAVVGGVVLRSRMVTDTADRTSEWGNYVSVLGDDGTVFYYCHLAERKVAAGEPVKAGQEIGLEGNTGRSTGVHLHFEVRSGAGEQKDPCAYLGIPNEAGYVWVPPVPWEAQASPWAKEAVGWAAETGILRGRGGGDYALREPVTREEMCVMLQRLTLSGGNSPSGS